MRRDEQAVAVTGQQERRPLAIFELAYRARGLTEVIGETMLFSAFAERLKAAAGDYGIL
jgi:hypothetical protein